MAKNLLKQLNNPEVQDALYVALKRGRTRTKIREEYKRRFESLQKDFDNDIIDYTEFVKEKKRLGIWLDMAIKLVNEG